MISKLIVYISSEYRSHYNNHTNMKTWIIFSDLSSPRSLKDETLASLTWEQTWCFQSCRLQTPRRRWWTGSSSGPSCPCMPYQLKTEAAVRSDATLTPKIKQILNPCGFNKSVWYRDVQGTLGNLSAGCPLVNKLWTTTLTLTLKELLLVLNY